MHGAQALIEVRRKHLLYIKYMNIPVDPMYWLKNYPIATHTCGSHYRVAGYGHRFGR